MENVVDPSELQAPAPGEGWNPLQESAPPQAPEATAESAELKQKLGQALQAIGELKRANAESAMDAEVARALASVTPQAPPAPDFSQFPQDKLNETVTIKDMMVTMNEMYNRMLTEAQAQALRATWDVSDQEKAAAIQRYPNLAQFAEGSPEQLNAIKRVVDVMRRSAQPAQSAPSAGSAPAQQTRAPQQRVVPMVEQSQPSGMPDGPGMDPAQTARAEYERAKQIKNPKERIAAMRTAFEKVKRATGVSTEAIHATHWRNES
jgi:hypothetical protein